MSSYAMDFIVGANFFFFLMGASGWMFLLVQAHPDSRGKRSIKWSCVCTYIYTAVQCTKLIKPLKIYTNFTQTNKFTETSQPQNIMPLVPSARWPVAANWPTRQLQFRNEGILLLSHYCQYAALSVYKNMSVTGAPSALHSNFLGKNFVYCVIHNL